MVGTGRRPRATARAKLSASTGARRSVSAVPSTAAAASVIGPARSITSRAVPAANGPTRAAATSPRPRALRRTASTPPRSTTMRRGWSRLSALTVSTGPSSVAVTTGPSTRSAVTCVAAAGTPRNSSRRVAARIGGRDTGPSPTRQSRSPVAAIAQPRSDARAALLARRPTLARPHASRGTTRAAPLAPHSRGPTRAAIVPDRVRCYLIGVTGLRRRVPSPPRRAVH